MTTTTFSNDTVNNLVKLALEKGDAEMLQLMITKQMITVEECIKQATEKGNTDLIKHLINGNINALAPLVSLVPTSPPTKRPLKVHNTKLFEQTVFSNVSELIMDICQNPQKALHDLQSKVVSLEEINSVEHSVEWTALHYLCYYSNVISDADLIVKELLSQDATLNAETLGGSTPLYVAIFCNNAGEITTQGKFCETREKIIEILLKMPQIDIKNSHFKEITVNFTGIRDYNQYMSDSLIMSLMTHDKDFDINDLLSKINDTNIPKILALYLKCYPKTKVTVSNIKTLNYNDIELLHKLWNTTHITLEKN